MRCLLFILLAVAAMPAAAQVQVNRKHQETVLAPYWPEAKDLALLVPEVMSPDGRRLAYVKGIGTAAEISVENPRRKKKEPKKVYPQYEVVFDGHPQKPYAKVDGLIFSPDSKWLAYAASTGEGQWKVVVNGREEETYQRVGMPQFSPDSKRLAYVALQPDGGRMVVVNGRPGKPYEMILQGRIYFSPDGRRLAYAARVNKRWLAVVDDQEGPAFDFLGAVTGIQFSDDGSRMAYAALSDVEAARQGKPAWNVILDGRKQPAYQNIGDLVFSPDGKRVAYAVQNAGPWRVSLDGSEQKPYEAIGAGTLRFNADGQSLVYAAKQAEKWVIVKDNHASRPYDGVSDLLFSPNGKHLAAIVQSGPTELVVANGQEQRIFDRVGGGTLVFSADSTRLGYVGRANHKSYAVIGSVAAGKGAKGGKGESRAKKKTGYEMVGYLTFTPDNAHFVYAASDLRQAFTVIDDREATHRYDSIWNVQGARLLFDSHKSFHYMAIKDGNIILVEEEVD
jgi:dipeptidyl aminopeptidase/acylaminoacyl peptidase